MKQQKHILFPKELIARILNTSKLPSWADFTTRVFMLLEIALADEFKKNDSEMRLKEERRGGLRHKRAG